MPIESSVPGPRSSIASNARSVDASRCVAQLPPSARPTPPTASPSSRRSTCSSSSQSRSYAASSSRSGYTSAAHARCGAGTMHQFVDRSPTIFVSLLDAREHVAPDELLVEVVEQVRRGQRRECDARTSILSVLDHLRAVPRRHEVQRVRLGVSMRARFTWGSKYSTSTNWRRGGSRPCHRARHVLVADLARDHQDLPGLDVGAVYRELRKAFKAIGHRQAMLRAAANSVP